MKAAQDLRMSNLKESSMKQTLLFTTEAENARDLLSQPSLKLSAGLDLGWVKQTQLFETLTLELLVKSGRVNGTAFLAAAASCFYGNCGNSAKLRSLPDGRSTV